MSELVYWGEHGNYGPFTRQKDGWPNAGEVIRHYRKKLGISAAGLAAQYGEAIGVHVTPRWILKMEQQNKVPTDMTRRRILSRLLEIPPILLGLASLEQIASKHPTEIAPSSILTSTTFDLDWYTKEIRILWKLHYAQTAEDIIYDIKLQIDDLMIQQQCAKDPLARQINELLNSYYRLAATIHRDRGNFATAYRCANESVRLAKEMGDDLYASQIVAASQYTRSVVNLAWRAFGTHVKQGKVVLERERIESALNDFERALHYASPQLTGTIYSDMARAKVLLSPSPIDITIALKLLEQTERFVDVERIDDFYSAILLNGDIKGLDKRRLILARAKVFQAIGKSAKVLEELDSLEMLGDGTSHTRRRAWTRVLYAQASIELGDYATAMGETVNAFNDCLEAHTLTHLARVNELCTLLSTGPYKSEAEVKHLKGSLRTMFSKNVS